MTEIQNNRAVREWKAALSLIGRAAQIMEYAKKLSVITEKPYWEVLQIAEQKAQISTNTLLGVLENWFNDELKGELKCRKN